ncbi:hypothetical protein ZPR_1538 [Zunongwangia profunda SM-A87]|uniref:Uncharacterized protein n=1 Tax=Zunongwangia profunda (strain DSM 18752 / CCTCC AB 206139 / SM-A87) TaxID=655815 RepID=D5BKX4_ZUNPS|nr:hypothetical protein ZPR_1538 [Zunongwangia profunda SM-A87]
MYLQKQLLRFNPSFSMEWSGRTKAALEKWHPDSFQS